MLTTEASSKPVRLCVVALHPNYYQDGIWQRLARSNEVELTVVYLSDLGINKEYYDHVFKTKRSWADRISLAQYRHVFPRNLGSQRRTGLLFRVNPGIIPLVLRERFDLVLIHGHNTLSGLATIAMCKLLGTPIVFRGEGTSWIKPPGMLGLLKHHFSSFLLRSYDLVMYSCTGNRNYFEARGVEEKDLMFIPCAVDNDFYRQEYTEWHTQRDETRRDLSILSDDVVVAFLGRLSPVKRVLDIVKSAAEVRRLSLPVHSKVKWVVIGDGPLRSRMEELVTTSGLDNFVFVGFQDQNHLGKYLAMSDIGILLSEYDPSPKALNEMMNFGLAVICTDSVGTSRDLVRDGRNGYLVTVGDATAVAQHLIEMVEHHTYPALGRESIEIVSRWTFERDVAAILDAIRHLKKRKK